MGFAVPAHESDAVAAGLVGAQMVHSGLWEGRQRGLRRRSVLLDEGRNIAHDVVLDAVEAVPTLTPALRLGFQYEGLFRQAVIYKGRNRDTTWFSIVDGEWPRLKRAYEQWLAPENFDGGGGRSGGWASSFGRRGSA